MIRTTAMAAAFLALAATLPAPQANAQETLGGAIGGAILGGAIGGAITGRAGGAAAGALIGGATGAMIGAQAVSQRRVHAGPARLLLLIATIATLVTSHRWVSLRSTHPTDPSLETRPCGRARRSARRNPASPARCRAARRLRAER